MASIMKRGDSYSVRYKYKDHSGKPCEGWESFKTRKEAQERKITVEKELLDGTFLVPDTITVEEMLYKWIPIQSTKHKWSPKTYTQSVAMVQNLIVPYIGKRKVQELRTYDIEKFYATLAKTPCGQYIHGVKQTLTDKQKKRLLSSTSIHEVHALLKTAFSYAVEWDLIHKIPLPREAPKANNEERTIWDEKTMLAALQTIENPALHLAVHMSMAMTMITSILTIMEIMTTIMEIMTTITSILMTTAIPTITCTHTPTATSTTFTPLLTTCSLPIK